MVETGEQEVEHGITVNAPADVVYGLVADVANWPNIFPPTVHVEHLERGETRERIRLWATANGAAKTWTSVRYLDPVRRRVEFRQEVSQPPVASMGGCWTVEPVSDTESRVRLSHQYRAVDDDPDNLAWIARAVDGNSDSELAAMKAEAEMAASESRLKMEFADTVRMNGSVADAYDFINEANLWSERLPHVETVRMDEETPGLQTLEMDTRAKDGSVHTTKSIRVCFRNDRVSYKQIVLPPLMKLHTGLWTFVEESDGVAVTSRHTVVLNEDNITGVLGADAGVEKAREYVHNALSTNSLSTLGHVREQVEKPR
ncbi:aromatase [Actinopolyspora biskrensis]|uniref:Aromatase n=1 Tax=Actinopolyspora biskrensis TaxID=1470178 RepID=A0A852ZBP5_9ACTN|nr:aromatase/cyclase [Actinopolyspora biskrensis]NYH80936.1 aromatase [Actinopolyspora biskrensis]